MATVATLLLLLQEPTTDAVLEALKWLSRHQVEDGSWGDPCEKCTCIPAPKSADAKKPPVRSTTFDAVVAELGSDDPEERERAMIRLRDAGPDAVAALEKAALSKECELRTRAELLLLRLRPRLSQRRVSATSLALLAFFGAGYSHLSKDQQNGICLGTTVKSGLKFLLAAQDPDGFIGTGTEHALAALAISEAYGLTGSRLFMAPAQKAIDALLAQQRQGGGWSAGGNDGEPDTLATTWAVMALKSAEISGLEFPRSAYDGARAWIDGVTSDSDGRAGMTKKGDWEATRKPHDVATSCAMLARVFIDKNKSDPRLRQAAQLLSTDVPVEKHEDITYRYFAGLALFQFDGPQGAAWKGYWKAHRATANPMQRGGRDCDRGSWRADAAWGIVETTALYALSLEVYSRGTSNVFEK